MAPLGDKNRKIETTNKQEKFWSSIVPVSIKKQSTCPGKVAVKRSNSKKDTKHSRKH